MTTAVVVMGVAGCGKTTVGVDLADRLGWPYAEADDFHSDANRATMAAGTPLTDADRRPWLAAIRDWMSSAAADGDDAVVTCSALRRAYRDVLRSARPRVRFVHLHGPDEVLAARIGGREGHFMAAGMLRSQLDLLEPLEADEDGIVVSIEQPAEEIVAEIMARLGLPA